MSHPFRADAVATADRAFAQWGEIALYRSAGGLTVETVAIPKTADVIAFDPKLRARQTGRKLELKQADIPARPRKGDTVEIGDLTYTILEDAKSEDPFQLVWVCRVSVHSGNRAASIITFQPALCVADARALISASADITLDGLTVIATAAAPHPLVASATITFAPLMVTGVAVISEPGAAFADITLDPLGVSGDAVAAISADMAITFAPLEVVAAGGLGVASENAVTFDPLTTSGQAEARAAGSADFTLDALTAAGDGVVTLVGAGDFTFDPLTAEGEGYQSSGPAAFADITFDALTADGAALVELRASAAITFAALTATGEAIVGIAPYAGVDLDALSASGVGVVEAQGSSDVTFDPLTADGAGAVTLDSENAIAFDALSAEGQAAIALAASATASFAALTAAGAGAVALAPAATPTFAPLTNSATALATIAATAGITFGAATATATGTVSGAASPPTVTELTHKESTTTGNITTASFTPANGSLLVAIGTLLGAPNSGWGGSQDTDDWLSQTITDSAGLTWTRRTGVSADDNGDPNSWIAESVIWTAPVTTGVAMTVTFGETSTPGYAGERVGYVFQVTGHNAGSPIGAVGTSQGWNQASPAITLNAAPAAGSIVIGALATDNDSASASAISTGSGFTQLDERQGQTWLASHVQSRTGSTSTSVPWTKTGAYTHAAAAIEIKPA